MKSAKGPFKINWPLKDVNFLSFISTGGKSVLHWCSHLCMQTNSHKSIWYIKENNRHCIRPPTWIRVVLLWPVLWWILYIYPGQQLSLEIFYILSWNSFVVIFHHGGIPPISYSGNIWILIIKPTPVLYKPWIKLQNRRGQNLNEKCNL